MFQSIRMKIGGWRSIAGVRDERAMAFRKFETEDPQDPEDGLDFFDRASAQRAFRSSPGRAYNPLRSFRNNIG